MSDADLATLLPASYPEAEAILQRLAGPAADRVWRGMSHDAVEKLLRSLAPAAAPHADDLEAPAFAPAVSEAPTTALSEMDRAVPRLSERSLLAVLETAPDAIVVIDGRGVIVLVNAQTEKLFGYDRAELVGKEKVEILVPIRHRARHVQQRQGFLQAPHTRAMGSGLALFGLHKDGHEFPVEISLSPLRTDEGMLVTSAIRDVTERNRRAAELAKLEARYRSLVEEIPAVTFLAALDGGRNELYVSPQIVDLLGFTQEEWLNDPVLWHRQLHPEDRERWHREFARTCATAQPFRSVYRFRARDGRVVWVHGEAKVVRDAAGRPMFLQGVAFDITERKDAEEQLRQLNRTLEERVADRTAALKRSNEALARYGDHVAHEMKAPVREISDILHATVGARAKATLRKRLADIDLIAADMKKLIDEMLDYARVGDTANKFAHTDCAAIFREVLAESRSEIAAIGARVSGGLLPTVNGHRESLKSVFRNLLSNAIKYRARRRLQVRVGASLHNGEWLISVRDNGRGIPKFPRHVDESDPRNNNWQKIFGLFVRYEKTGPEGDKIAGHGIGLAYCQRVIEHHGGKIWVESEYPKGSTFFFTLPVLSPSAPPA